MDRRGRPESRCLPGAQRPDSSGRPALAECVLMLCIRLRRPGAPRTNQLGRHRALTSSYEAVLGPGWGRESSSDPNALPRTEGGSSPASTLAGSSISSPSSISSARSGTQMSLLLGGCSRNCIWQAARARAAPMLWSAANAHSGGVMSPVQPPRPLRRHVERGRLSAAALSRVSAGVDDGRPLVRKVASRPSFLLP